MRPRRLLAHRRWLAAPRGSAFLWVSPSMQPHVRPLVVSHGSGDGFVSDFIWDGARGSPRLLRKEGLSDIAATMLCMCLFLKCPLLHAMAALCARFCPRVQSVSNVLCESFCRRVPCALSPPPLARRRSPTGRAQLFILDGPPDGHGPPAGGPRPAAWRDPSHDRRRKRAPSRDRRATIAESATRPQSCPGPSPHPRPGRVCVRTPHRPAASLYRLRHI
eukprot:365924-Chlamydomonas_euryale.AAC.1